MCFLILTQMDKKQLKNILRKENEHITDILLTFDVPNSLDADCDDYLLTNDKTVGKGLLPNRNNVQIDDLQDRLNMIKNKMKQKKRPSTERAKKKREAKKLKNNKEFKKVLVSAARSIKNENHKQIKGEIKEVMPKPVFNEEGKIVFSKFDFAAHPGAKVKKSHQNPREILKKIKATDKKIHELNDLGEEGKAAQLKSDIAWKKAFDKIEGKKVKDDPKLLYKSIKKRKVEKKKSKQQWVERKKKVEAAIDQRQKKRQENINKRAKDKTNKKLKTLSKKGRVIPGF